MSRYRPIKKWGNTFVIVLKSSDIADLNLKIGDEIDLENAFKLNSLPSDFANKIKDEEI